MRFDRDDPRWTAYVLGELNEAEEAELEKVLAESAEARVLVEELEGTADALERALAREESPGLLPEQLDRIEDETAPRRSSWMSSRLLRGSIAAGVALVLSVSVFIPWYYREPTNIDYFAAPELRGPGKDRQVHGGLNDARATAPKPAVGVVQQRFANRQRAAAPMLDLEAGAGGDLRQKDEADAAGRPGPSREAYDRIRDNEFRRVAQHPLSTFSIDVDTASYGNVRRFLMTGSRPPADAVRIEELLNYFSYEDPLPVGDAPFAVSLEAAPAPWEPAHLLLRIGLKGREVDLESRPASNLVFLIDVSGSMGERRKLPLLKEAMGLLVEQLDARDRVAIVVYAGASGVVLPSTAGDRRQELLAALERLEAGGSTHGSAGIQLAYRIAGQNYLAGGINRVILATDGDFNVGVTSQGELTRLIEEEAKSGVFLSVLGFGTGNYQDSTLEKLADRGNGNYAYLDGIREARKVLVEEMAGTLLTIAKDVKIQVEFNPARVGAYRLIGYENRLLRAEDFNDDRRDAGEIGAGHSLTVLYELVPAGVPIDLPEVDPLRYQTTRWSAPSPDLLTVKLRYKEPQGETSRQLESPLQAARGDFWGASDDFRFAAAVAGFGMLLRDSPHKGEADWGLVLELAESGVGADEAGHRGEFVELVSRAAEQAR